MPNTSSPELRSPVAPRDAATVILVREDGTRSDALLVRRRADLAFAGGTWVFPGGKLESADHSARALGRLRDTPESSLQALRASIGKTLSAAEARGLFVAACRETFEEIGVLLARHTSGQPCDPDIIAKLQPCRAEVSEDPARFPALLEEWNLVLEPARLVYWSHWITPSVAPRRFDARFFVAAMPPDQDAKCDSAEATQLLWLDLRSFGQLPDESLVRAPATRFSLGDLARRLVQHGSLERLLTLEAGRKIAPMMPKLALIDARTLAVMPWDSAYHSLSGDGTPANVVIPEPYPSFPSRLLAGHDLTRASGEGKRV